MSELTNKFVERLASVKKLLYEDAMKRKWFSAKPETARGMWVAVAIGVMMLGAAAAFFNGYLAGRALIGLPVIAGGLALLVLSRAMARRTATGSEALRRVLGFRLYISTAETRRQEFNEQQNIFARYLPFAIVFGCVGKWAKAFEGLDDAAQQSTQSWYTFLRPVPGRGLLRGPAELLVERFEQHRKQPQFVRWLGIQRRRRVQRWWRRWWWRRELVTGSFAEPALARAGAGPGVSAPCTRRRPGGSRQ
jgi:hypothetical protein